MLSSEIHPLLVRILEARGIGRDNFAGILSPNFEAGTHDPFLLPDMKVAVQRVCDAIDQKQNIVIFGDYDADGIPAAALLADVLEEFSCVARVIIPRRSEGYGLTEKAVERILSQKPSLVITVDNGSTAVNEVAALQGGGVDVIILDHHEVAGSNEARAYAHVNPKREKSIYDFRDLCAAAIAWKFAEALFLHRKKDTKTLRWYLDLVALSTIADMVPLVGENRVLAYWGLHVMRKTRRPGIRALAQLAGIELSNINSADVGFRIAPRINAPGRMHAEDSGESHVSLELLRAKKEDTALHFANICHEENVRRQALVEKHRREARDQYVEGASVQIVGSDTWSTGVIGLVASTVCEETGAVSIALAPEGSEIKGSLRAPQGASCLDVLALLSEHLRRSGGHTQAAGLTAHPGLSIEALRSTMMESVKGYEFTPQQGGLGNIPISLSEVTIETAELISDLEPFGVGFESPKFEVRARIEGMKWVGVAKAHLILSLKDESVRGTVKAVWFRAPEKSFSVGDAIVAIAEIEISEFNGETTAELRVHRMTHDS